MAIKPHEQPWLIAVVGPTASGKTSLAIALAQFFGTEIISFDSRQCYAEMNIGVARPTPDELAAVTHHFIASHSIYKPLDAASYANQALQTLEHLFTRQKMVIAVGGTGLYLKSLLHGLDDMPDIPLPIRENLRTRYAQEGLTWLTTALKQADPAYAAHGDMQNPHRMLRALETVEATGSSILTYRQQKPSPRPFQWIIVGIDLPKNELHKRIAYRTALMQEAGLVLEAASLFSQRHLQPLQTVGYHEIFDMMLGHSTEAVAFERIATHTRQYAKRQLTWFRNKETVLWLPSADSGAAIALIQQQVGNR